MKDQGRDRDLFRLYGIEISAPLNLTISVLIICIIVGKKNSAYIGRMHPLSFFNAGIYNDF